ncbi:MAG: hypothetical protein WBV06_06425 [Acidimicrobiia bacterium]|jgi:hypothetical protein
MNKEHTLTVVEPTLDGDSAIDLAKETRARGGDTTIVLLLGRETVANVAAFAKAEDLAIADGREIYFQRLTETYENLSGGKVTLVFDGPTANRWVFDQAARSHATSVVLPQRLVNRRNWKASVSKSQVPVLLAPPKAA